MSTIMLALTGIAKKWFLKLASEKFLEWLFLFAARSIVQSTKTTKDDEFLAKVEETLKS